MNNQLRPKDFTDFIGQEPLKRDLSIMIKASKNRKELTDHILFSGPPGLGKTTLSSIIASELGVSMISTSAPAFEKPGDIASLLTSIKEPSVIFIDEIHALDRRCEELLYSALEDGHIDLNISDSSKSRSLRLRLNPFTLVGATTQPGSLSGPLRDRFGYQGRLELYNTDDIASIIRRSSSILNFNIDDQSAKIIAQASRGTPRIANHTLKRVRDYASVYQDSTEVTSEFVLKALESFGIDSLGLDNLGRKILLSLIKDFKGGPVGVQSLAASLNEDHLTISEIYEPFFLRSGLTQRTPRGRVATEKAYQHLGLLPPSNDNLDIFTS